jgi:hypothetical protein
LIAVILIVLAGTFGVSSAAAVSEPRPQQPKPFVQMELKVSTGLASSAVSRARYLYCDPTGGNHPYGVVACHDLDIARGDLGKLPGKPGKPCSGLFAPVQVIAMGEWRGMPVYFRHTYRNQCVLRASTGPVFEF